jgi:hypothetical protein
MKAAFPVAVSNASVVVTGANLDKAEATAAFVYLNQVRPNPPAYSQEIGVDLSTIGPRPQSRWDANLAKMLEKRVPFLLPVRLVERGRQ